MIRQRITWHTTQKFVSSTKFRRSYSDTQKNRRWQVHTTNVPFYRQKRRSVLSWIKQRYYEPLAPEFWYYPKHGLFKAACIDTAVGIPWKERQEIPTVLCLHGSGGHEAEFLPLVKHLVEEHGFRAVCLFWPGYGLTRGLTIQHDQMYHFKAEERVDFLLSFLQKLQLTRLDMVIGHGFGCDAACFLGARGLKPRSVALISPTPCKPFRGMNPHFYLKLITHLARFGVGKKTLQLFSNPVFYSEKDMDESRALCNALTMSGLNFDLMDQLTFELEMKKMPQLLVYGDKDDFIERSLQDDFARRIGMSNEHFDIYDERNNLTQQAEIPADHYSKGIRFHSGSHSLHQSVDKIPVLVDELTKLYQHAENMDLRPENNDKISNIHEGEKKRTRLWHHKQHALET